MSSSAASIAIQARGLGKCYQLGEQRALLSTGARTEPSVHWALDDVSFDIRHGEAVGVIGHNGAGKSTLLKLLSRITEPSRGQATIYGRVASLLEVGTGFHPELTGRENVLMNGSILGMRRAEILRHLDEIVEFAGVHSFLDTPVKRYSSGMQMRLAFSVAAHLQPEILVVDEVLAVGDVQFQKKCMGKMGEVSRSGRTVLFVSHNMAAVRQLTTRCLVLSRGRVRFDGAPAQAIETYSAAMAEVFSPDADLAHWPRKSFVAPVDRVVEFRSLRFEDGRQVLNSGDAIRFVARLTARSTVAGVRVSGSIVHAEGYAIGTFLSDRGVDFVAGQTLEVEVGLADLKLSPGSYSFVLWTCTGDESEGFRHFDVVDEVLPFEIGVIQGDGATVGAWHSTWGAVRLPRARLLPR